MKEIPPFRLVAKPLTEEAAAQPPFVWAESEVGKRHRLGGRPERNVDAPSCRSCGAEMSFYGQFDSINDDYSIADAGLIYVYLAGTASRQQLSSTPTDRRRKDQARGQPAALACGMHPERV
jgi:hypothetical protein